MLLAVALCCGLPQRAPAQTPSPLQEWQYSSGIILQKMFQPDLPAWRVVLGAAVETAPLYDGAQRYRVQGGPVINIRYRDLVYLSTGEGLGVNLLSGPNYRAGIAVGYDLGRKVADDYTHLHGLGNLSAAPMVRAYASYAISKKLPLVFRADVRQIIGGADGLLADFGIYMPLPGSSKTFIMFAGPSITVADRLYQQHLYGVSPAQAMASGRPEYAAHGGANSVGFGFSATRIIADHWLINADSAANWLLGSARASPLSQSTLQAVLALSIAYSW
jgi:outer membrane scaffolding protein for murein synthesis (MipA/OmpV family)